MEMNMIKIVPAVMEFLCSDEGYGSRQHFDIGPTAVT
jgi:hypothetical protein